MILHHDNHFIYNCRASFKLPNDMAIDYSHEVEGIDDFRLVSPDESFKLLLGFLTVEKTAKTFTEEIYEHFDCITAIEPVHTIETPCGLSGYATSYDLGDEICEEFAIDLPGATHALFYARFSRLKDNDYDEITYEEAKEEILASIKEL